MPRKKKPIKTERGDGSFRARECGTLEYRFVYKDEFGISKRKSLTGNTEEECYRKRDEFLEKVEKKRYGVCADDTIPDILRVRYEMDLALNYVAYAGYDRNIWNLKIIERHQIGKMPIRLIKIPHIQAFLVSITKYSNSTIEKSYQQLKLAYELAMDAGIVDKNIMKSRELKRPKSNKPNKVVRGYTVDEQKQLEKAIREHIVPHGRNDYRNQILLELYTGMRVGEVNALMPEDVDLENHVVHVHRTVSKGPNGTYVISETTKTSAGTRDIPLSKKAEEVFRDALNKAKRNKCKTLFYDYIKGDIITSAQVNSFLGRICEKADIPFSGQHALRHTYATRCLESGVDAVVLKTWMGHTDIHVTLDTYADVFKDLHESSLKKYDQYLNEI